MTTEPRWPDPNQVVADFKGGEEYRQEIPLRPNPNSLAAYAIDKCRAAWAAENDDPSQSPIGEMRETPTGHVIVKFYDCDDRDPRGGAWVMIGERLSTFGNAHPKGWPVIGAVPGTPAAGAA